jgi:hypothetical protein
MTIFQLVFRYGYVLPTVALLTWTAVSFVWMRFAPLYSCLPQVFDWNPIRFVSKSEHLDYRPGLLALTLAIIAFSIPVLNLLFVANVFWLAGQSLRYGHWRDAPNGRSEEHFEPSDIEDEGD